jgi:hypothetical protein
MKDRSPSLYNPPFLSQKEAQKAVVMISRHLVKAFGFIARGPPPLRPSPEQHASLILECKAGAGGAIVGVGGRQMQSSQI